VQKIVFIINPISGTASKKSMPALIDKYIDKNRFDVEIKFTEYAGHASVLAKEAREAGIDVVVAVGGDGTINEVARTLTKSKTALGIIPCGSGNGLARHLMLPLNTKGALEVINNCEIHDLDYGIINGHPFFCTCGMGFDAFISAKFAEAGKRGPITYAENVLKEGLTYKPETYTLTLDDAEISYNAFLVSCANASQYGNDAYIAPQASMKDGLIDVVIIEPFDLIEAPSISLEMFNKTLDKNSKIKYFKTRKLHIHREHPGVIHYDGDPIEAPADLDIELVHQGIRIVVNPNADKRRRRPNRVQSAFSNFFNELQNVKNGMEHLTSEMGQQVGNPVRHAKRLRGNSLQRKSILCSWQLHFRVCILKRQQLVLPRSRNLLQVIYS
jgi:YegS/Rv2252/BmrU family lipid kinase